MKWSILILINLYHNDPFSYFHNSQPTATENNIVEAYLYLSYEIVVHHLQIAHALKSKISFFSSMQSITNKDNPSTAASALIKKSGQLMNIRKTTQVKNNSFFQYHILSGLEDIVSLTSCIVNYILHIGKNTASLLKMMSYELASWSWDLYFISSDHQGIYRIGEYLTALFQWLTGAQNLARGKWICAFSQAQSMPPLSVQRPS